MKSWKRNIGKFNTANLGSNKEYNRQIQSLLNTYEAANFLGLSPRTLEALRLRGGGPPFIRVTVKAVRYKPADLDAWIESRRRHSTSDLGMAPLSDPTPRR